MTVTNDSEPQPPFPDAGVIDRAAWGERIGIPASLLGSAAFAREYPFASRLHDIGGNKYHYIDEGKGEPVVMVHGNPTWSFFYRRVVEALRGEYRCLAADHMGCGLSAKPQNYSYRLRNHIDNLEHWLESVLPPADKDGGRINLIVHDWGGPTGIGYAVRHPERINRVVALNTSVFTDGDMPFRIKLCRWPGLGPFLIRGLNAFAGLGAVVTTVKPLPPEVRRFFVMPYNTWDNRVAVNGFVQDIPLDRRGETYEELASIQAKATKLLAERPTLVQWGMKDWCFTPYFLNLWRTRVPNAEADEYQAGHYLLEDAGADIIPRIRAFLERPLP